ncbi:accessory gene regulator B family protein [Clostridium sp. C2-6-12]|uniref:accessory gene regulator ArgB-like protein n=1 Tax=Clostridium sp. C2-6-12 TaxID=2698832 RepID=UPI001368EC84|nr:accessory gene regulator B family protein [Clostridium sp. C2-6-12]
MIITKKLSNLCLQFIKDNTSTSDEDAEKIYYGLQVIMLDISKSIILLGTAYLLGVFKYTLIAFLVFAFLRSFASGAHANSTLQCIIVNYILFLGNVYLSLYLPLNTAVQTIIFILSLLLVFLYAPGDTEERPLVSKKLRKQLKIKSILIVIAFFISIFVIESKIYTNLITFGILEAALVITPIVYRLFGKKTNNYKNIY